MGARSDADNDADADVDHRLCLHGLNHLPFKLNR